MGLLPSVFSRQPQSARTTRLIRPPLPTSPREYTPARSADRHRPEAHRRNPSILSAAVTATGTTFWAAWIKGTSSSDASRQHDLISAPVQLVSSGREEFSVGMERSGSRSPLFGGEGLSHPQPREREFHGGHRGAESLGGVGRSLGCGGVGWLGCGPARCGLAGVGGCVGCGGHWVPVREIGLGSVENAFF
jgi:hypothetical protein